MECMDTSLSVSTVSIDSSLPKQNTGSSSREDYNGSSLLAREGMVLGFSKDGSQCKEVTCPQGSGSGHVVTESSTQYSVPQVGRCSTYWEAWGIRESLSDKTRCLVESSWRNSTESQYSSAWNAWLKWSVEQGISSTSPTLTQVMEYFSFLYYELKREYRTINTHRSTLSSTLAPIDGFNIGQHPLIKRQLKGIFNLRPPQVALFPSWSVQAVLDTLQKWGPAQKLSLKLLSYKTVTLLALSCAKRVSSLSLLTVREGYLEVSEDKIVLQPFGLEKHSRPDFIGSPIEIKALEDSNVCPVAHLQTYLSRTKSLRQSDSLFVTLNKPHKEAAVATIASWVKSVISQSGQSGTGGSVRSVATSSAFCRGVSLEKILKAGDWSRVSTFKRFYYKSVPLTLQSVNLRNK